MEKDITEKTLEAYNDVFADIINGLLFHGEQIVQEHMLTDAQPLTAYKADGKIREQERDIGKYLNDASGNQINARIAFLGIENQTTVNKDMTLRVLGYDGASYRAQLAGVPRYPVITLVLYFGDTPWRRNRSLHGSVLIPDRFRPFVSDYKINIFEIARLPEDAVQWFHSDFRIVADYFIHKRTDPDYRPKDPIRFRHVDEALKLLSVLTQDRRFEETLYQEGGKPENMCEVLDRVEARGMEKGIEKGIESTYIVSIRNLMKNVHWTADQAMDALGIPAPDRNKYLSQI